IPRWLKKHLGFDAKIDIYSGRDYPDNLSDYKLIIHCGGCMITRNEKLSRMRRAGEANVPITNYGIIISYMQGVLERVLSPFPDALKAYYEG
ncbi:MAG TPA: [FeFe] hydrogenase H-cluster maturation GTPase HydF, partial [Candidatus Kapabacteria bacterium]|nr:[FeFe] hydrogenase H-cluster maturation GTPase HydF [Candidatus Kapabacteria bacterium]